MARHAFTISGAHVALQRSGIHGKSEESARIVREARQAREAVGVLQPRDVLKRVYVTNGVCQAENDEQRAARLAASPMATKWTYEPQTDTIRTVPQNYCVASLAGADAATDKLRNGEAIARVPEMIAALRDALRFVEGFEGDELQEGISALLINMRAALGVEGL